MKQSNDDLEQILADLLTTLPIEATEIGWEKIGEEIQDCIAAIQSAYIERAVVAEALTPPPMRGDFEWPCLICGFDPDKVRKELGL
jgi:hypothetical protein